MLIIDFIMQRFSSSLSLLASSRSILFYGTTIAVPLSCICLFSSSSFVSASSTAIDFTCNENAETLATQIKNQNSKISETFNIFQKKSSETSCEVSSSNISDDLFSSTSNYRFAGFHGTSADSLICNNLKPIKGSTTTTMDTSSIFRISTDETGSTDDGNSNSNSKATTPTSWSGGELGNDGIYISTELNTALIFGATQTMTLSTTTPEIDEVDSHDHFQKKVAVFEVYYDSQQQWNEPPTVVLSNETFEKLPKSYQVAPHDVLVVQNDGNNFLVEDENESHSDDNINNNKSKNSSPILSALKKTEGRMHLHSLLPSQYKVNSHKLGSLIFILKGIAKNADEAFEAADLLYSSSSTSSSRKRQHQQKSRFIQKYSHHQRKKSNKNKNNNIDFIKSEPLPILNVMPDGNCLFHSLAWHLKLNSEERGKWLKKIHVGDDEENGQQDASFQLFGQQLTKKRKNIANYFGFEEEHLTKTMELKRDLVDWMIQEQQQNPAKLEETWHLITVFGEDTSFFGSAKTLDQYLQLLKNECEMFFSPSSFSSLTRRRGSTAVFADIQLFAPALLNLFPSSPIIVFTDTMIAATNRKEINNNLEENSIMKDKDLRIKLMKPLVFCSSSKRNELIVTGNSNLYPVQLSFSWGSLHYNAVSWRGPFATRKMNSKL